SVGAGVAGIPDAPRVGDGDVRAVAWSARDVERGCVGERRGGRGGEGRLGQAGSDRAGHGAGGRRVGVGSRTGLENGAVRAPGGLGAVGLSGGQAAVVFDRQSGGLGGRAFRRYAQVDPGAVGGGRPVLAGGDRHARGGAGVRGAVVALRENEHQVV